MKPFFLISALTLFIFSCSKEEKEQYVTIAGKVQNAQSDSVIIMGNTMRKAIALHDGEFLDTLKINESGYFQFFGGKERTQIFLNPGDSLHILVDTKQFDESLQYGGTSAEENNYLAQKYLKEEAVLSDPKALYTLMPVQFKSKLDELKAEFEHDLEVAKVKANFKELQKKNIQYDYLVSLDQYPQYYNYFTGEKAELPVDFAKGLEEIDLNNEKEFLEVPSYKDLVMQKTMVKIDDAKDVEEVENIVSGIQSQKIKDEILKGLYYEISTSNPDAEKINDIIQKYGKDEKLLKRSEEKIAAVKNLLPGNTSPKFAYKDINNKEIKLDDLKGKLIYIDVWATWCGPCLQEIPSLKKLEADYHGKNVEFVSISIDTKKDFEKWQKMVKDKSLKGIQLFADNDWKSDFVKAYAIDAIPRFLLIDQNGNIISADAPRPSDPEIRTLIEEKI